jgi:hypothetical protein
VSAISTEGNTTGAGSVDVAVLSVVPAVVGSGAGSGISMARVVVARTSGVVEAVSSARALCGLASARIRNKARRRYLFIAPFDSIARYHLCVRHTNGSGGSVYVEHPIEAILVLKTINRFQE